MSGTIEPRYGAEVYVSETGKVCIKQSIERGDEQIIILHHEEVAGLIHLLHKAQREASESNPEEDDDAES